MSRQPTPNVLDMVLGPAETELSPLTTWENGRLAHLERIIEAGLQTFYDVGGALMEIREGRLYRQTHRSFEAYTKERWGMGKSRAHQLIEAASTVAAISGPVVEGEPSTIVDTLPVNESQVRPLAGLDDQAKREVWAEAVATAPAGKVTGRHVEETVRRRAVSIDLWAVAANSPGSRQKRAEALAGQIMQWIETYRDSYGRGWREIAERGNPAHTNSVLWDDINKEAKARGVNIDDRTFKEAINQAFSWLAAKDQIGDQPAIIDVEPSPKPSTIVDTLPGKDGRIERAQRLIDQCRAITGRAFEEEYTALIGRPSDLLVVGRALDKIVAELEHLQRTLGGEPEVDTWGEL